MKNKSKKVGYILAFFLGGVGAHAFYYRKYVKGSLYLIFCWTVIPIFLGWIDMFFIKAWHNKIETNPLVQKNNLKQKATKDIPEKKETNKITMDDLKNRLDKESVLFSDGRPLKPLAEEALKREEHKNVQQIVYAAIEEQQRVDYTLKREPLKKTEEVQKIASPIVSPETTIPSHVEKRNEIEETVIPAPEGDLVARFTAARKNKTRLKNEEATVQWQKTPYYPLKEIQEVVSTLKQVQQLQRAKADVPPPTENTPRGEQVIADTQTVPITMNNIPSLSPHLDEVIKHVEVDVLEAIDTKVNEAAAVKEVHMEAEGKQEAVETIDVEEEEPILSELTHPSPPEEPPVNMDPERQPKIGFLLQASKLKRKIEESLKNLPDVNVVKPSNHFYNEDSIILPKFSHIETPREILKAIKQIRHGSPSKNSAFYVESFSYNGSGFIKNSLDYATKKGVESPEIPLHAYWTTFDSLNGKQKQWYFYWRAQVLNGNYPDVDLSYIILFVYELLNYSFNQKAAFNISMMVRLHDNYVERLPKVSTYIGSWTADMLREVGENDLLEEWTSSSSELYMMPLYKQLKEKQDELARISFTLWKPYIHNYNETVFFNSNKHKVYKLFKESFPLLQKVYQKQGEGLIDRYFELKEERTIKYLYNSAVIGRKTEAYHVQTKKIQPTTRVTNEVTALFRLAENVTRLLNGEKRQLKVEEAFLPEGFKEMMLEHFTPAPKETTKRFKVVQKAGNLEGYGSIPPPPEGTPVPEERTVIEFNSANIKMFQAETEELVAIFNARSTEEDETPSIVDNVGTGTSYLGGATGTSNETNIDTSNSGTDNDEVGATLKGHALISDSNTEIETTMPTGDNSTPSDIFLALEGGGSIDGEEDFIESLTAIQKEFLVQFDNGVYDRNTANSFLKQKGIMLGMFISEINEKANEFLGDNFLESQDEEIAVYEEFEQCIITLKGTE